MRWKKSSAASSVEILRQSLRKSFNPSLSSKSKRERVMITITAILEPDADGTLHLPLPPELRKSQVKVTATLEAASLVAGRNRETPLEPLKELRKLGTFHEIPDPMEWQREQRKERPLP